MKKSALFVILLLSTQVFPMNPTDLGAGVIIGAEVQMRESPSLTSRTITLCKEGEIVKVLEWTTTEATVGINKDRWIKVQAENGKMGFVFGNDLFDIRALFIGKWAGSTASGDTLYFITFDRKGGFTIDYEYPFESRGPGITSGKESGHFTIRGREIHYTITSATKERGKCEGKQYSEYLFRHKGCNYISNKKHVSGTRINLVGDEDNIFLYHLDQ